MALYKFTNNASALTTTPLGVSDISVSVTPGAGALFPGLTTGLVFIATLTNPLSPPSINEIVLVTARASDTMSITRAQEGTVAQVWPVGSQIQLLVTALELSSFAQPPTLQAQATNYAVDTGVAGAYVAAFTPPLTAPVVGAPLRILMAHANVGASTLNADGTARPIAKPSGAPLSGGEIILGAIQVFTWNGTAYQLG